ncbi:ACN9-domain-containing protein [Coprinopsis marcescibilis]|uniref:Succinate dehydrogenase assembly factor 3 n=1 Tax=Coprinopsis marcescibilis TaxID=230819 RepID=A0A5C3KQQ1_COPMA|nr:ACN9-domain-containing protein [Coprinopsis marcescibilis]
MLKLEVTIFEAADNPGKLMPGCQSTSHGVIVETRVLTTFLKMRASVMRLALSISRKPLTVQEATSSLLPPIPLYRRILRVHRHLPHGMRSLGDVYVKSEFRRHQKVTNPAYLLGFLSQWKVYLDQIPVGPKAAEYRGKPLDPTVFEKMTDEQLGQLYEFKQTVKDVRKPENENF